MPFLSMIAGKFWRTSEFSRHQPVEFTIKNYGDSKRRLDTLLSALWGLTFARRGVQGAVRYAVFFLLPGHNLQSNAFSSEAGQFHTHFDVHSPAEIASPVSLLQVLSAHLQLLEGLVPPSDFIDPEIQRRIQLNYLRQRLRLLDGGYTIIKHFISLVLGQDLSEESFNVHSHNPLLREMALERESICTRVEQLSSGNGGSEDYYRPPLDKVSLTQAHSP
jgi:hypothetical protein